MPPPPPPPSRPRGSPPPCPPPPPPSPVRRADAVQQPAVILTNSIPELPKRDYTPVLPAIILPPASASQLLAMLRTLARVVSWLGVTGGVAGFIYYRYILPRLDETLARRAALKAHALALATRLASQLHQLQAAQAKAHGLPAPPIPSSPSQPATQPAVEPTAEVVTVESKPAIADLPAELAALKAAHDPRASSQRALQALSSLTSYVSARTYGPGPGKNRSAAQAGQAAAGDGTHENGPEEAWEEALSRWEREAEGVVREARAVKGLVLNRRSFAGAV
ncbi:hypothetical protein CALCODRAFT_479226 [Calocera cornea HHB12733]|uniref:Peroxin-14 n=1 Tax=Calocera cornea HHB12733 TaxID=1353952 RepID=A0A165JVN2_9BASI|nr:hypothetical protein CALCODRAFT_479226 [Calocera cornea HHB12733]